MENVLDIIIIGAGPIGLACGLEARNAGLEYLILEKGVLVNSLYHYPANMTFFSTSEKIEIGAVPFVSNNPKPTRAEALEYYRRIAVSNHLRIRLQEPVGSVRPSGGGLYEVITPRDRYFTRNLIVATGFYGIPNLLHIPGEDLQKVTHYYKEPHYYAMQKVVVIGANNSAVDAALETWRKGAAVTMVIQGDGIGRRVKYWVKPDIENRIAEGSVKAFIHSRVTAIRPEEVDILTPEGLVTIANDFVLAMTGYQPDFSFLRNMGVQLSDDSKQCPAYNSETMESNRPGIYLAGVVCGGMDTHIWFIENSREHAQKIVKAIRSRTTATV